MIEYQSSQFIDQITEFRTDFCGACTHFGSSYSIASIPTIDICTLDSLKDGKAEVLYGR